MALVTSDPAVLALDLEKWTAAQVRGIASVLAQDLYRSTPVDTGYARSNWVVSVGTPVGEETGTKATVDDSRFIESLAFLQTWTPANDPLLFITNNVPYINRLNNGWSQQAPAGFIEAAIDRAQQHAEWPYAG